MHGLGGMITVAGGKLTTYRSMAKEVVDQAVRELRFRDGRPRKAEARTDEEPLPGGEAADLATFRDRGARARPGPRYGRAPAPPLWHRIGRHLQSGFARPWTHAPIGLRAPRNRGRGHSCRPERAGATGGRRARAAHHLYYELPDHGVGAARRVAELMAGELGWDVQRSQKRRRRAIPSSPPAESLIDLGYLTTMRPVI